MFGFDDAAALNYRIRAPATFKAMQNFVMALDHCARNMGRRSFLGRDKTPEALASLALQMGRTIVAMKQDGLLSWFAEPQEIHGELQRELIQFFEVCPTWRAAAAFSLGFFNDQTSLAIIEAHSKTMPLG